jgi:hypothetical protein
MAHINIDLRKIPTQFQVRRLENNCQIEKIIKEHCSAINIDYAVISLLCAFFTVIIVVVNPNHIAAGNIRSVVCLFKRDSKTEVIVEFACSTLIHYYLVNFFSRAVVL